MTDEKVHLYIVHVAGLKLHPVEWAGLEQRDLIGTVWTYHTEDWKALLIMNHYKRD